MHFFTKILKTIRKILIIIQRSNGDVLFASKLISELFENYNEPEIDILVNEDTSQIAELLNHVNTIHLFSYEKKDKNKWKQERLLFKKIFRKYDLSINLTSSDRSVIYSILSSKRSISSIEKNIKKSWWKKILLYKFYYFDFKKHILLNNLKPLDILKIEYKKVQDPIEVDKNILISVKKRLEKKGIKDFLIYHPSAQYSYKVYPLDLRNYLLKKLSTLGIPIVITGGLDQIDFNIKETLPLLPNIYDFIGETSLEEYFALSFLSGAYIGMDTLNMHIASSQNKRIFAIFGPTLLSVWSPWSNKLEHCASTNIPVQTYDNITIFQAPMSCVACGKAGCNDDHGKSECLHNINPKIIFDEIQNWQLNHQLSLENIS